MSDYVTALTGAGTAMAVGLVAVARTWPERKPRVRQVLDEMALSELLGPWEPVHGAAVVPTWRDCRPCGKATAGSLNKDGWLCGECLTPAGGVR